MDPRGQPVYKEWSPWPGWILIVFWGTMVLAMALVAVSGDEARGQRILGAVVLGIVAIAVQWLVAGLSVRLYRDAIVMGIGSSGWISKRVRYDHIVRLESVRYHPLREFGGWGIKFGRDGKRAWTARGDEAVVLELGDGTRLYVGSDHPHRLEERIRALAGTRLGSTGPGETHG
jgi:hypothetical protein